MIQEIIHWLVPFLCGGLVSLCATAFSSLKKQKKKEIALNNGVQCLLRAEIIRSYDKYTVKGFCPLYAKEALKKEYDAYHELGGNDVATDLYIQMMKLPAESKVSDNEIGNT